MVDLVAGGDGTTHRRGIAIDSLTGASGARLHAGVFKGDRQYHSVPNIPVLDGCFVPDGAKGPIQVDSAGDMYLFPTTSNSSCGVWAGGQVPSWWATDSTSYIVPIQSTLANVDYAQDIHGLLHIHSNAGLTLDLAAIRRLHPSSSLSRFRCIAGNSFVKSKSLPDKPLADLYVLVDGKPAFARRAFSPEDRPFVIEVTLQNTDRFLTLATTDGGDTIRFDWVLFADPVLDLKRGHPDHFESERRGGGTRNPRYGLPRSPHAQG